MYLSLSFSSFSRLFWFFPSIILELFSSSVVFTNVLKDKEQIKIILKSYSNMLQMFSKLDESVHRSRDFVAKMVWGNKQIEVTERQFILLEQLE